MHPDWPFTWVVRRHSANVRHHVRSLILCGLSAIAASMVVKITTVHAHDKTSEPEGSQDVKRPDVGAPAKGTGRIWGRVVKGDPAMAAPGATVILLLPTLKGQHYSLREILPLRRTTSGTNGEFRSTGLPLVAIGWQQTWQS